MKLFEKAVKRCIRLLAKQTDLARFFNGQLLDKVQQKYMLISDAQNGEDIILYKLLNEVKNGFYIDIGCSHHINTSVTNLFYNLGWSGVNIDARKEMIEPYKKYRQRDISICAVLSDTDNVERTLYINGGNTSVCKQAINREAKPSFEERRVATSRFSTLMTPLNIDTVHFLKIDVEQHEKEVLCGIDFTTCKPWVVVIESVFPGTTISSYEAWEHILLENEYAFFAMFGYNRYYLRKDKYDELMQNFISKQLVPFLHRNEYLLIERIDAIARL